MVQILPLTGHHDRQGFDCGDDNLNQWLKTVASQHKAKGISSTFVAVDSESSPFIYGFFSINITEVDVSILPPINRKKLPAKIPAFRIGRLAVSSAFQGKRLGALLLGTALDRIRRTAQEIGGVVILVDAKPGAIEFYEKYHFEKLYDHQDKLFLII